MDETKPTGETVGDSENQYEQRQQQIVDMGSTTITTARGTIHTLTIVGQIEGHQLLPSTAKTTKYEHVMPLLAAIEESDEVDGLLVLLNTVGGDIEAGLGISILPELVLRKTNYQVAILPTRPVVMRKIGLVMKDKNTMPIASKYFIEFLFQHIDQLP